MQQSGQTTDASHNSITARLKNSSYLMPLFLFAVIILLLLLIFVPGRLLYLHYTAYRKYQKGDYMPLLLLHYPRICRLFSGQVPVTFKASSKLLRSTVLKVSGPPR